MYSFIFLLECGFASFLTMKKYKVSNMGDDIGLLAILSAILLSHARKSDQIIYCANDHQYHLRFSSALAQMLCDY